MKEFKVEISRILVDTEPSIEVFNVTAASKNGIWEETLPDETNLKWLLKGMEIGASLSGSFFPRQEIPRKISHKYSCVERKELEETQI